MVQVSAVQSLTNRGAAELAGMIAAGEVSSAEVVERHVERIEAVNPRLNAVVVPFFERARAEAAEADRKRQRGEPLGPLHGVPITIKEQFEVQGAPSTWGLPSRARQVNTADGPLVRRLRDAGAIVLGVTNVPQLLIYHESDNPVYGRCNNPWSVDRVPGGSSGGEGAIIAAGGSPLGLGSDIGGSIRIPAHFCGIHGIKPTSRRLSRFDNPLFFAQGQEAIIDQPGPLARRVEDLELALSVLAGPDQTSFDYNVPPVGWPDPKRIEISKLRIAMYSDDGFFSPAPEVRRAVEVVAGALRSEGATVESWTPPRVEDPIRIFYGILGGDGGASAKRWLGSNPKTRQIKGLLQLVGVPNLARPGAAAALKAAGQQRLAFLMRNLRPFSADEYWQLVEERNTYQREFLAALDAGPFDAIIGPPHALPALTHGASYYLGPAASYSMLYNLLGLPGGVVAATRVREGHESDRPSTKDVVEKTAGQVERGSAGLPLGVQVAARHWREDIVLAVMAAVERRIKDNPDYPAGALAATPISR
ncbi:MAG TPA: amidase family protein [Candidatus Dormibacteraeota bacterium]